ncbi:MAG: InlB B-repeat-containing protein, partial [Firmicutes bacterium]|nr:InlB B-repeat-containing protein [Bacillota bacterium]
MKIKKLLVCVLVALLVALPLGGCGVKTPPAAVRVTFYSDGEICAVVEVKPDAQMPSEPQKQDHTFGGWFLDEGVFSRPFTTFSDVTADTSVYAKWTIITPEPPPVIAVTFRSNGQVSATVKVEPGAALPAAPQKPGFIFGGWFLDDETFLEPFTTLSGVTESVTVFAKWVALQKLSAPAELSINAETKMLTWAAVSNAVGYSVDVDGQLYAVTTPLYSLAELTAPGAYKIRVTAKGNGTATLDSDWSVEFTHYIDTPNLVYTEIDE